MKLNRFIIYTAISMSLIGLSGCSGELDDIRPKDKIASDQLTEEDLNKVVNGVYSQMESYAEGYWWDGDKMGENFRSGPGGNLTDPLNMSPENSTVRSRWNSNFTSLKQVNFLIETFESNPDKGSSVVKQSGGVGYFFRAFIYYNVAMRWGKAPILYKRTYDDVPLSAEEDVWQFILEDLDRAEEYLSDFKDRFYVSLSACHALKARVLLKLNRNEEAIAYADKVISNPAFSLTDNSADWAKTFVSDSNSKELILALANKRTSNTILLYQSVNDVDGSWNYSAATDIYAGLYGNTPMKIADIRSKVVFGSDPTRIIKFANGMDGQFVSNENPAQTPLPLFRLPEMYLIKAEAEGPAKGLSTIKTLLEKRYATVNLPATMTDREFQDLILDERQREFYGEGYRWFDLKRTNRLDLFKGLDGRTYLMYWPIPQDQIDLAGKDLYPQNPGY